jgi:hypothetical protein
MGIPMIASTTEQIMMATVELTDVPLAARKYTIRFTTAVAIEHMTPARKSMKNR